MLLSLMEDKRIDYNAPLLSVRRFYSSISSELKARGKAGAPNNPSPSSSGDVGVEQHTSLLRGSSDADGGDAKPSHSPSGCYNYPDVMSGPVRRPGVVPFQWEDVPGCPKEVISAPPPRPPVSNAKPRSEISGHPAKRVSSSIGHSASPGISLETCGKEGEQVGNVKMKSAAEDGAPNAGGDEEEEDTFSDALETLSRSDSCFMNCSVSAMTGVGESLPGGVCFSLDPHAREFMMDRFLPAAQAMATDSTHHSIRKMATPYLERMVESNEEHRIRPVQLNQSKPLAVPPYLLQQQHRAAEEESDGEDDDDDSYSDAGRLPMKGCGFLPRFCLKGSFCLMNPVPGVRVRARGQLPHAQKRGPVVKPSTRFGSNAKPENEQTRGALYKQKLGAGNQMQLDDGIKLASDSNQLTYWSDSQSADGSSPYRRSVGGGGSFSPYRNDSPQSPFREVKGFLGFPKEEGGSSKGDSADSGSRSEKYMEIQHDIICKGDSGHESSNSINTADHLNSDILESPESRFRFAKAKEPCDFSDENSDIIFENGRTSGTTTESCIGEAKPIEPSMFAKTDDVPPFAEKQNTHVVSLTTERLDNQERGNDDMDLQPLLPPPLPKSPSESWLSRTLPSFSSKNHPPPAFLGAKFIPNKKSDQTFSASSKSKASAKYSITRTTDIRFSEILANPIKEDG